MAVEENRVGPEYGGSVVGVVGIVVVVPPTGGWVVLGPDGTPTAPAGTAVMPTIGRASAPDRPPRAPALPKARSSPVALACQYPSPSGVGTMAAMVRSPVAGRCGAAPKNLASPKEKTPPSEAVNQ